MALRNSENGPEFQDGFLDSLLAGDVIFLCGTGVSSPQMPDFRRLVERTCELLDVERTASEELAFGEGRFEEVLGSLSRRLSDPQAVTNTVSGLLAAPDNPILDQHRTILRLSRNLDNQVCVVTTNFDTLLERAMPTLKPGEIPRNSSFAGQALPAPGSASFSAASPSLWWATVRAMHRFGISSMSSRRTARAFPTSRRCTHSTHTSTIPCKRTGPGTRLQCL